MKNLIYTTIAGLAVVLAAGVQAAQAQECGSCPGYFGNGWGGNFGLLTSPYALGRVPTPPYFALHPPVYYSQPVPRTYGYSPFAYPASVRTPDVVAASAQVIVNPHVSPAKASSKLNDVAQQGLEIVNPFVDQTKTKMVAR